MFSLVARPEGLQDQQVRIFSASDAGQGNRSIKGYKLSAILCGQRKQVCVCYLLRAMKLFVVENGAVQQADVIVPEHVLIGLACAS